MVKEKLNILTFHPMSSLKTIDILWELSLQFSTLSLSVVDSEKQDPGWHFVSYHSCGHGNQSNINFENVPCIQKVFELYFSWDVKSMECNINRDATSWNIPGGHVGSFIKYFRSPQENLRAHNEIEFIFSPKMLKHGQDAKYLLSKYFSCAVQPETFTSTFLMSIL